MSGAGSAQLDLGGEIAEAHAASLTGGSALRQQAAERLQAHRMRRGARHTASEHTAPVRRTSGKRAGVAAAVAERYAQSPSYRAVLAEEARRAIEQAEAEAAVAARNAEAVAAAQGELLAELEMWTAPQVFSAGTAQVLDAPAELKLQDAAPEPVQHVRELPVQAVQVNPAVPAPVTEVFSAGLTVKLYEDLPRTPVDAARLRRSAAAPGELARHEAEALEEEISFRQAPVFEDFRSGGPVEPIAGNLLEFPRQLVAPKKARPRHAEGPLLDEAVEEWQPRGSQLRIFEVGAKLAQPEPEPVSSVPEWSSIWLDSQVSTPAEPVAGDETVILPSLLPPATAPVSQRVMAATVDVLLVASGVLGFVALAAYCAGAFPTGLNAAASILLPFAAFYVLYHLLFFSLSGQTPGMRYARIGLCTFTDENPSRAAMRKRVLAMIVAASPLGLGLLWVWLDDDRLGWHDRMSRMYQRAY